MLQDKQVDRAILADSAWLNVDRGAPYSEGIGIDNGIVNATKIVEQIIFVSHGVVTSWAYLARTTHEYAANGLALSSKDFSANIVIQVD